jgi:battenin
MYFCYQIGVFISRTSLVIVKIKRIEILTLLQIANFTFLFVECFYQFVTDFYILFGWLIFVGLMGGGSYVNCFYFLLEDKNIETVYRELSVNIATVFNDIGILSSSLTILLFKNTFMD